MNPVKHPGARHRIFPELLTHLWLACLAPGLQCDLGIQAFQRLFWCCREIWNTGNARAGWLDASLPCPGGSSVLLDPHGCNGSRSHFPNGKGVWLQIPAQLSNSELPDWVPWNLATSWLIGLRKLGKSVLPPALLLSKAGILLSVSALPSCFEGFYCSWEFCTTTRVQHCWLQTLLRGLSEDLESQGLGFQVVPREHGSLFLQSMSLGQSQL